MNGTTQTTGRFDRTLLPEPLEFYEGTEGLVLKPGKFWRQTICRFCGSSDNMAIKVDDGGFHCWSCEVDGGDILDYYQKAHDVGFIEACKALGCWIEAAPTHTRRKKPFVMPPRQAMEVIAFEALFLLCCAGTLRNGNPLTDGDMDRLATCTGRIRVLSEEYAA